MKSSNMESASPPSLSSRVLQGDIPHILEEIFLYLDYESLKTCFEVCNDWRKILKSESFRRKANNVFAAEITTDQKELVIACGEGDIEMIKRLLSTDMLNVNREVEHPDETDYTYHATPLSQAVERGETNAVKLLLERGADPNNLIVPNEDGYTALHLAAQEGYKEVAQLLLDGGANPNLADMIYQNTALHFVALEGHNNVLHVLLSRGGDPNITNEDGNTPLHHAAQYGHKDAMQVLLGKGADPNVKDGNGDTPLSLVLIDSQIDDSNERRTVAQILLDAGANLIV